jgi:putative 4-mercaptohistidine N1-methyltranferase
MTDSSDNFYESERAIAEYLLFHYGEPSQIIPYEFGPAGGLDYAVRCVSECLDTSLLSAEARALDVGCAVGRSSFELARHCSEVVGIDFSNRFIGVAKHLKNQGAITYAYLEEGGLTIPTTAVVPETIERTRVTFEQGDAQALRKDLGTFEVILMANLIDRLVQPQQCLKQLSKLMVAGGQLIITSPYTWLEEYTPREHWLGGCERDGHTVKTLDTLKALLAPEFELQQTRDLPFLIREHARKFQWSVAEASLWIRK